MAFCKYCGREIPAGLRCNCQKSQEKLKYKEAANGTDNNENKKTNIYLKSEVNKRKAAKLQAIGGNKKIYLKSDIEKRNAEGKVTFDSSKLIKTYTDAASENEVKENTDEEYSSLVFDNTQESSKQPLSDNYYEHSYGGVLTQEKTETNLSQYNYSQEIFENNQTENMQEAFYIAENNSQLSGEESSMQYNTYNEADSSYNNFQNSYAVHNDTAVNSQSSGYSSFQPSENFQNKRKPENRKLKKKILIGAGILLIIIGAVTGFMFMNGSSNKSGVPEELFKNYASALQNNDAAALTSLVFTDSMLSNAGGEGAQYKSREDIDKQSQEILDDKIKSFEETYGKNMNLTCTHVSTKKLDDAKFIKIKKFYNDVTGIKTVFDEETPGYTAEITLAVNGSKSEGEEKIEVNIVNIKNSGWKIQLDDYLKAGTIFDTIK